MVDRLGHREKLLGSFFVFVFVFFGKISFYFKEKRKLPNSVKIVI